MKLATKFCRTIKNLATTAGLPVVAVPKLMPGVDSQA